MNHISITRSLALNREQGGAIVGIRGTNLGKILRIQPKIEILLGRDTEKCDICFSSPKVSRVHCRITYHLLEQCYTVVDCSMNGIYREDGRRLKKGENHGIQPGTELWIGTRQEAIKLG